MHTLEKIRQKSWILAVLVIGLIVLFVAGDLFRPSNRPQEVLVAKVNEEKIPYRTYDQEYQQLQQMYAGYYGNNSFLEQQNQKTAFQNVVRKSLLKQMSHKIGLIVAQNEAESFLFGDNMSLESQRFLGFQAETPDSIKEQTLQYVQDIEAGRYNAPEYENLREQWNNHKAKVQQQILNDKIDALVSEAVYVTEVEAARFYEEKNKKVSFELVGKKFKEVPISEIDAAELEKKYQQRKNEKRFERKNQALSFRYVVFPIEPTLYDQQETMQEMEIIKTDWANLEKDTAFITLNNENRSLNIQEFNEQLIPNLSQEDKEKIKKAKPSELFGPYLIEQNLEVKLLKVKVNGPEQERKVTHLLIQANAKDLDQLMMAQQKADSLKKLIRSKEDFIRLVEVFSEDPSSKSNKGDLGWLVPGQTVESFEKAAFSAPIGVVQTVVSDFGVHLLRVDSIRTEQRLKVAVISKKIEPSIQTEGLVYNQATEFISRANTGGFVETAKEKNTFIHERYAFELKFDHEDLSPLKHPEEMLKWLYKNKHNSGLISDPLTDRFQAFVVVQVDDFFDKGVKTFTEIETELGKEWLQEKKTQEILQTAKGLNSLEELANAFSTNIQTLERIDFDNNNLPEIGKELKVLGTAFGLKEGQLSEPIVGEQGVYWIQIKSALPLNLSNNLDTEKNQLQQKYRTLAMDYLNIQQEKSKIEDLRLGE